VVTKKKRPWRDVIATEKKKKQQRHATFPGFFSLSLCDCAVKTVKGNCASRRHDLVFSFLSSATFPPSQRTGLLSLRVFVLRGPVGAPDVDANTDDD